MAKRKGPQNLKNQEASSYNLGMIKDLNASYLPDGAWASARNAVNNSEEGDLGILGNEQSNKFCASATYTIIGKIKLYDDRWILFSTDDTNSEIGIFDESECSYSTLVNDPCLSFKRTNLITGEAKENFECHYQIYWSDGLNPDRSMDIEDIPWNGSYQPVPGNPDCVEFVEDYPRSLNCEKIRLVPLRKQPCFKVTKATLGGQLLNGSYMVTGAYTLNGQVVTDYFNVSKAQAIFNHQNVAGSIDVEIVDIEQDTYDEFKLVVIAIVNGQTRAYDFGIYSTRDKYIYIDYIDQSLPTVPLEQIPLRTPNYERSEGIFRNGDYLMRVAPTAKFDFNYQPLANQILAKWSCVEYPADYYAKGGNNPSFLRDEQYAFYIRWIYNTGERSSSYHIPGRAPGINDLTPINDSNTIEGANTPRWKVYNTATFTSLTPTQVDDKGWEIAEGNMGYWESTERYPDNKPDVWDQLCGKPVRHHKFPDTAVDGALSTRCNHFDKTGTTGTPYTNTRVIRIMGVKFEGIKYPVDNNNNPIEGIVGYEILRSSREGNKSIIAKGMINNMFGYVLPEENSPAFPTNYTTLRGSFDKIGLYANYPFNDVRVDPFILKGPIKYSGRQIFDSNLLTNLVSYDYLSFHSPDTQFKNPFLSAQELKLYGVIRGTATGRFKEVENHPEHKFITDFSFVVAAIGGLGIAMMALVPDIKRDLGNKADGRNPQVVGTDLPAGNLAVATTSGFWGALTAGLISGGLLEVGDLFSGGAAFVALDLANTGFSTATSAASGSNFPSNITIGTRGESGLPMLLRTLQHIPSLALYWSEGTDQVLRLLKNVIRYEQYGTAYEAHCEYDELQKLNVYRIRRGVENAKYIGSGLQDYDLSTKINNLYRGSYVCVNTTDPIPDNHIDINYDNTRNSILSLFLNGHPSGINPVIGSGVSHEDYKRYYNSQAQSYYGALKVFIDNQYGQVTSTGQNNGNKQIPIGCAQEFIEEIPGIGYTNSDIIFGGDTYISRFTEKNTFFYFYDWMNGQPDGYEFNYYDYINVPYPLYWMDTKDYDASTFISGLLSPSNVQTKMSSTGIIPSDFHYFDRIPGPGTSYEWEIDDTSDSTTQGSGLFRLKNSHAYIFNSGVRDFYVESEVNTDLRDWGDKPEERHYDPYNYTTLRDLFHTDIIKSGNYYKYDYSLSVSRSFREMISWGNTQPRDYDPEVSEDCYVYYPKRVIYSLPQNKELKFDNWRAWLVNNYKDFSSRVTTIKPIGKNGAMMLFDKEAPIIIPGVDTLQTTAGTEITIGDGGLFSQPLQNIVNTDRAYEYGSCQNRESVINTPYGLFYVSQNQGKIFRYAEGLQEISRSGMQWWFNKHLPYRILEDFPNFDLLDNSVIGVGVQCIYDNSDKMLYVCKRDFKLRLPRDAGYTTVEYQGNGWFLFDDVIQVFLGDPAFFNDASWTVSFDPKVNKGQGSWISFHDWHPTFNISSKASFMTVNNNSIWKHNDRCDSYCNFYGVNYPFEIETIFSTKDQATILNSVEYTLECYKIDSNCIDWHHKIDENFDEAIIYNTEQISGLLNLNLYPKNDVNAVLSYPVINPGSIDILFSKEENKYRFNQFWDITDDRGEFSGNTRVMWETEDNGYVKDINPFYINYNKAEFERKKFRHYLSSLILRKNISGDSKFLFKLSKEKQTISPR